MGGKSRSDQTTNTATQNTNLAIQGDNEGQVIGGDGNSVTNTTTSFEIGEEFTGGNRTEIGDEFTGGNRFGDDFTGGNRTEIDGDFTGGNRTETEIDGNFYNGNYTVTDGGAFALAEEVVKQGFNSNNKALENSFDFAGDTVDKSFDFATGANNNLKDVASTAIDSMKDANRDALNFGKGVIGDSFKFGSSALNEMSKTQANAMDNVTDGMKLFAEELQAISDKSVSAVNSSAQAAIKENSETTTKGLMTIEQLAAKTALGGQTVVAEQAGKMAMYFMGGAALIFLGLVVSRAG
ncbi:hypothetical protein [Shewanella psychrotolerans]|uniref:hypothetical protein n=1 Tax=Shewanella psychrotolerans TaxID=2864206 RepID=UPI001C655AB3|nr:hypothetical protein [Shewanella psychrotolerans]QYK03128.1 hypothetical protein K0I62_09510 [Shewanella psychrotolerans]